MNIRACPRILGVALLSIILLNDHTLLGFLLLLLVLLLVFET